MSARPARQVRTVFVHWNVTAHPTAPWVWQQIIEATPGNLRPRYLIRDTSYSGAFVPRAARLGIRTILTLVRAPTANAIAERVIGTLRRECLDHVIVLGERHLRGLLREYVGYYNATRPHRHWTGRPLMGRAACSDRWGIASSKRGRSSAASITRIGGGPHNVDGILSPHRSGVKRDRSKLCAVRWPG